MNPRLQAGVPFASFGLSLAAFFLLTFHSGWVVRGFDDQAIWLSLAIMAGVPLSCVFIVLARERIKHVLQLVMLAAFEISGYLVLFTYSNAVMNVGYWSGAIYTATFSLLLGSMLSMLMLAGSDLVEIPGYMMARMQKLAGSIILPGIITGFMILVNVQDWFTFVLLAMMIEPVAVILHFVLLKQPGSTILADQCDRIHDDGTSNIYKDPIKGLKFSLFLVAAFVNLVLLIGINGILMGTSFFMTSNWLFYIFLSASANCILLALIMAGPSCLSKDLGAGSRPASIAWTVAGIVQFLAWMAAMSCEFMIPGFHGSSLAQVIDGVATGTIILTTFQVVFMQLPPRHEGAFAMLIFFFFGLAMVFGQYLKIIPTKITEFNMYGKYLPYILGVEGLLYILLTMLLIIPIIVKKKA